MGFVINLYSDTQTVPTPEMFEAARTAPLGDDVAGSDPTVNRLQDMAADRMGMEAALFLPSGTMANLVALMAHGGPGDEVVVAADAHIYYYESGALSSVAGYLPLVLPPRAGFMDPEEVAAMLRPADAHFPTPRVLALENTHNLGGGAVLAPERQRRLCELAHARGLAVHLDGARIFNAAVALGVEAKGLVRGADTVMFCLSKGLSCPAGSLLCGPRRLIERAFRIRKRLGGAMRQAGVLAAMGIVALDTMVERLAEDHANARMLAEGLSRMEGVAVDLASVQTNMVYCRFVGRDPEAMDRRLLAAGVRASREPGGRFRFVTHRGISKADVEDAVARVAEVLRRP